MLGCFTCSDTAINKFTKLGSAEQPKQIHVIVRKTCIMPTAILCQHDHSFSQ